MPTGLVTVPDHVQSNDDVNQPSIVLRYLYVGTIHEYTARAQVLLLTPTTATSSLGILHRQRLNLRQISYDTFDVEVVYGRHSTAVGTYQFDFDTTGGTAHITSPKEHIARYGLEVLREPGPTSGLLVPKHKGAIGVDKDEVKGVDIVVPALKFRVTFKHPAGFVSIPFMKLMSDITGSANLTTFFGFAPGEILFLGVIGSSSSDSESSCTYSFSGSANQPEFYVGDVLVNSGIAPPGPGYDPPYDTQPYTYVGKRGHDVLWVKYKDNTNVDTPVKEAEWVYVDRVYDYIDMASIFGFGG